ncbi:MAG TPA: SDR family oxidoreductase [Gemmatimonadaceae bacterium]|nr:SDR family oxidoreductase [Gemmatimonadaceae bacterium]
MILIAGATGSLGSRIAHSLLDDGNAVRAFVRPTSTHASLLGAGADIAFGDLKDLASITRACDGVETVITTASVSKRGDDDVEAVDRQGNRNLVQAASAAGVRHVIFTSTVGASPAHPVPLFRIKAEIERLLRESGMTWTVLQPNAFMDVWFAMLIEKPIHEGMPVTLVGESRRRHSFVAERDVAAFACAAVNHPAARNATIQIGGPEALTFRDVVRQYERATGHPIEVRGVPPGDPIPGLPEPVWGIAAGLETYDSIIPMDETAVTYGIELTSAEVFARSRFGMSGAAVPP